MTISLLSNYFNSNYYTEDSLNKKLSNVLTSRCNFSLIHLNIRSAPKHISEFESYINSLQIEFSIVGFSETWFHDSNVDVYSLNGYNHEYMYRKGRLGGGVSLFIKKMIDYKIRNDLNVNNGNMESLFIEITKESVNLPKNVIVGIIYRQPNRDIVPFNSDIDSLLCNIKNDNMIVYLMGDFNINLLNVDKHIPSSQFLETMYS